MRCHIGGECLRSSLYCGANGCQKVNWYKDYNDWEKNWPSATEEEKIKMKQKFNNQPRANYD